jgi:3-deoxy-D-manno-octulosonate 8-phosphate phosphatase (KDO 8-P phosphatase)
VKIKPRIRMKNLNNIDFSKITFVLMDMDGVLTDGTIIYSTGGEHIKVFSVYDGYGIERGHQLGMKFGIISGRSSEVNILRAKKLHIEELYQDCKDKVSAFEEIKSKYKLGNESFCYIGDEVFDMPLLRKVAFSCAPANAVEEVKEEVHYVTKKRGGEGAIREIIDLILKKRGLI